MFIKLATAYRFGVPAYLIGFVCAFHPDTLGLNPKHTIYAFIKLYLKRDM